MNGLTQPAGEAYGEPARGPHGSGGGDLAAFADPVGSQLLRRACGSTGTVLAAVQPTDLDRPTLCASWTVRDVINHIHGSAAFYAELAEAGQVAEGDEDPDPTAGDFNDTFRHRASRPVAAFNAPDAMDKIMRTPIGELPGTESRSPILATNSPLTRT
jgi:uncharacterized protein (TIGR03086 family)